MAIIIVSVFFQLWSDLATEFNSLHRIQGLYIKQDKLSKKWQNWKSYNKLKGLPHPTEVVGNLDDDVIKVKLRRLRERVCSGMLVNKTCLPIDFVSKYFV